MKFFGVILILAVASCQGSSNVESTRSAINAGLAALVEQIREVMITGDESQGIPPLEPFHSENLPFEIDEDIATVAGTLTNLTVRGLTGFVADPLTFTLIGVRFTYCLSWDKLTVTSEYDIEGTVAKVVPIYGTGDVDVELGGLKVCGNLGLAARSGYLYIRTIATDVTLEEFDLQITGFLNNDDLSSLISAVASDVVPQLIADFSVQLNEAVSSLIVQFGDELLGTMTLADLIGLING